MRTDRTFACTDCRIRCWPVRRCPACGETRALVDLDQDAAKILRPPTGTVGRADLATATGLVGGAGLTIAAAAATQGILALAEIALAIGLPLVISGFLMWPRDRAKLARKPDAPELRYRALESPVVRESAERVSELGRVRARGTITAPISGRPCVAWRLVGEGPRGPIDDARGVPFVLVAEDGGPEVEVDATIASIDLPVPDAEPLVLQDPDAELAAWLRARGADPAAGTVVVREAILEEGAAIEVIGTSRRVTRADGYRGSSTQDVLADVPGSPLIVRPPVVPAAPDGRSIA